MKLIHTIWLGSALLATAALIASSSAGSSPAASPERHEIESARRPHYDILGKRKRILYAASDVIGTNASARREIA